MAWLFLAHRVFRINAAALEDMTTAVSDVATPNFFVQVWEALIFKDQPIPIYSMLCVFASVFVVVAIAAEFYRGAKLRTKRQQTSFFSGLLQLVQRNKRRYGGYIIHIGIVIVYIGIMGSKGYFLLESKSMQLGDSMEVGAYQYTVEDTFMEQGDNYDQVGIIVDVEKDGKHVTKMKPARNYYFKAGQGDQDTIESAIHAIGLNDIYIAIGDLPPDLNEGGLVNIQIYQNPLIKVLWIGVFVMVLGGLVAIAQKHVTKSQETLA